MTAPKPRSHGPFAPMPLTLVILAGLSGLWISGCATPRNTLWIVDYRDGRQTPYRETFDECHYAEDGAGNLNIVMRRQRPVMDDPAHDVVQVVCIRTFWTSVPGTTVAHDRQINASVRYAIFSGRVSATFEGAGSVFFEEAPISDLLRIQVRQAFLAPHGQTGEASSLFHNAELRGALRASHDPARVVRITNELDRMFDDQAAAAARHALAR